METSSLSAQSRPRSSFCCKITEEQPGRPRGGLWGWPRALGTGPRTHRHEGGVDVAAVLVGVAVVVRGLLGLLLALLAEVQLVSQLHAVEVVCTERSGSERPSNREALQR